jgi:hypothetical protein
LSSENASPGPINVAGRSVCTSSRSVIAGICGPGTPAAETVTNRTMGGQCSSKWAGSACGGIGLDRTIFGGPRYTSPYT